MDSKMRIRKMRRRGDRNRRKYKFLQAPNLALTMSIMATFRR
jgi:hypothetical protein